ncbi:MAG: hypothetical protein HYV77_00435 [Candidatus Wildermuthbacteria bacterium]|nr:hypothetical protein [Candidatus Wildermuthbacteria bacterium]
MQSDPEKKSFDGQEGKDVFLPETEAVREEKSQEEKEAPFDRDTTREKLEEAVRALDQNPAAVEEARKRAAAMPAATPAKTVDNLVAAAKEKGVVFAVRIAKEINDPFILDALHDRLIQEGMLKDFS